MTRQDKVNIVFLDEYGHTPFAISPAAFTLITAIVRDNLVCKECAQAYTPERPKVARNLCLHCLLESDAAKREKKLTFAGEFGLDYAGRDMIYKFLDADGYVYLVNSDVEFANKFEKSVYYTAIHWGFTLPDKITWKEQEKSLDTFAWTIYGDFRSNPVIVARYHEYYGDHLETAFFVYKDKFAVEINKRLKAVQLLFRQARERLELTKDAHGMYHYEADYKTYQLEDVHLYPVISTILSEQLHIPQSGQEEKGVSQPPLPGGDHE